MEIIVKERKHVRTFSRAFPTHHLKAGQPTHFIEKIYAGLADISPGFKIPNDANDFWDWHEYYNCTVPKYHTVREGHHFKVGDLLDPRIWSGKPYASKQIKIAEPIKIVKTWNFDIIGSAGCFGINKRFYDGEHEHHHELLERLAMNDGLSKEDFVEWFDFSKTFEGQIICWNESIEY